MVAIRVWKLLYHIHVKKEKLPVTVSMSRVQTSSLDMNWHRPCCLQDITSSESQKDLHLYTCICTTQSYSALLAFNWDNTHFHQNIQNRLLRNRRKLMKNYGSTCFQQRKKLHDTGMNHSRFANITINVHFWWQCHVFILIYCILYYLLIPK